MPLSGTWYISLRVLCFLHWVLEVSGIQNNQQPLNMLSRFSVAIIAALGLAELSVGQVITNDTYFYGQSPLVAPPGKHACLPTRS